MNYWLRSGLIFGLSATLTASSLAQAPVRVAKVQRQVIQKRHAVTGSLRARSRGDVAALEAGKIVEITVREGDVVKKGDIVARVDARRLESQKKQVLADKRVAEADLESHRAQAERAKADYARSQRLVQHNAASRSELDEHKAAARVAEANIQSTQRRIERTNETIELLDIRLADTVIRAPYDASVIERHAEPGDWLQPGEPLLTLVSTGPIEAWLEVPERYASAVTQFGDAVVVRTRSTGDTPRVLSSRRVSDVNRRVRTLRFIVTLENSNELLSPGMSVDGWIAVTGDQKATTVPKDAVIRDGTGAFVYRIDSADGEASAEKVPVNVLFETPNQIAIQSSSLEPGEQVVVEGNERLAPGQALSVITDSVEMMSIAQR